MTTLAENRAYTRAEATASAAGFTRYVELSSALDDLAGWVRPDADLTATFDLICVETSARISVLGEMFDIEGGEHDTV